MTREEFLEQLQRELRGWLSPDRERTPANWYLALEQFASGRFGEEYAKEHVSPAG